MSTVKIPGVLLQIGGRHFVVPPLNFRSLRQIQPKLSSLTSGGAVPDVEQLDSINEIVHLALSRNYPELTREELEDLIDLDNLRDLIGAIMGVSGLEKTTEDAKPETPAESHSAGATSTDS